MPLNVHGAEPRVIAMDERVGHAFAEGCGRVVRHADAQHADEQLLLPVVGAETGEQLVHHAQERPTEKIVDADFESAQHLERDLVDRKQATQALLAAEEQESQSVNGRYRMVRLNRPQGLGKLHIGQVHQTRVAAPLALADEAPEALELEGIEVVPARVGDRERRVVEQAAIGLQPLHLVEVQRQTGGLAVAAESTPEVLAVARPNWGAGGRNLDDDHVLVTQPNDLDARRERRPRAMGDERLEPQRIRAVGMARARSRDASVVFHAHEQPAGGVSRSVGEAHDGLDEIPIRERARLLALELHVERLGAGDERAERLGGHELPP